MFHEYGWTYDQFKKLTLRQIDLAVRKIAKRRHNNFAMEASLHGANIPLIRDIYEDVDNKMSPEKEKRIEAYINGRMAEKQRELSRGKRKPNHNDCRQK